ncbi:MAG: GH25 family lysozyme [Sphingomonas sp.]
MRWWSTLIGRIAAGLVLALLGAVARWVYATRWAPAPRKYPIQGVDVSDAQGAIVWPTLAARGADFAYLRATSGAHGRDQRFADNWQGAAAAGLRRGAVHQWSFCQDGAAQADNFVTTVPRTSGMLPAVLDLSFSPDCDAHPDRAVLIEQIKRFLVVAETHTGEPMLIKITKPVERAYQVSAAIPRPIWEARRFFSPDYAARPWRIWQASDIRRVDGVSGPIHWDVVTP